MATATNEAKATRQEIMEAARVLFGQQGFDRTCMRDITDRLSLPETEISRFFASKDDLLEAIWSGR